jgi:hypothetical protein
MGIVLNSVEEFTDIYFKSIGLLFAFNTCHSYEGYSLRFVCRAILIFMFHILAAHDLVSYYSIVPTDLNAPCTSSSITASFL